MLSDIEIKNFNLINANAVILDLQGRFIESRQIEGKKINISDLEKGMYFLKLVNSKKIVINKFIRE